MKSTRPDPDTNFSAAIQRRDAALDWREQETLLMREVMKLIGRSLAPEVVLREMLHLMSELLGLNRGRIVLRGPGGRQVAHQRHGPLRLRPHARRRWRAASTRPARASPAACSRPAAR